MSQVCVYDRDGKVVFTFDTADMPPIKQYIPKGLPCPSEIPARLGLPSTPRMGAGAIMRMLSEWNNNDDR